MPKYDLEDEPIKPKPKATPKRQVTVEQAIEFAKEQDLLFFGETSCLNIKNNCKEIFD